MDYIEQITAFNRFTEQTKISLRAQVMYLKLFNSATLNEGKEWFPYASDKLMQAVGISTGKTFYLNRSELINLGLIECKKGRKGKSPQYRLVPFINKGGHYELLKTN